MYSSLNHLLASLYRTQKEDSQHLPHSGPGRPHFYLLVTVFIASVIILPLVPVTLFIYTNLS